MALPFAVAGVLLGVPVDAATGGGVAGGGTGGAESAACAAPANDAAPRAATAATIPQLHGENRRQGRELAFLAATPPSAGSNTRVTTNVDRREALHRWAKRFATERSMYPCGRVRQTHPDQDYPNV